MMRFPRKTYILNRKRRERFEGFLGNVKLLNSLDSYEKMQIADALKTERYSSGAYIIKQGEEGNRFYILEEGEAVATKTALGSKVEKQVMQYKQGDYFGELALLRNTPRAANVVAKGDCTVVSIDSDAFKRLLGPLEEILIRNTSQYESS